MITNIDIDEELVAQAMSLSGARTKREVVDRALREMVARARRPRFRDFAGVAEIDPDYNPKDDGFVGGRYAEQSATVLHVEDERVEIRPKGRKPAVSPAPTPGLPRKPARKG